VSDVLLALPAEPIDSKYALVFETNLKYKFDRLNIKSIKDKLIGEKNQESRSRFLTMVADIKKLKGYICDIKDLE